MTAKTKTALAAGHPSALAQGAVRGPQAEARITDQQMTDIIDTVFARSLRVNAQAATTTTLAAYTRVGSVITADANGALGAIDGETLIVGERLLLKNGAAGADNGVYVVTAVGGGGAKFVLTRADDMASGDGVAGAIVYVEAGTVNAQIFICTSVDGSDVVNTDALTFATLSSIALTSVAPLVVAATGAAAVGTEGLAAHGDHVHAHGLLADAGALYHDSDQAENMSGVAGADVTAALNTLNTALAAAVAGLDIKPSVAAATIASLPAYSRTVDVITADANGALAAIDGITLGVGELLLQQNGASAIDNGIYVVTAVGDGSNPFVLTRISAMADAAGAAGAFTHIEQGGTLADHWGVCTDDTGSAVVNTDALTFSVVNLGGLSASTPVAVAAAAVVGTGTQASHDDHVHAHGLLANGAAVYHDSDQVENLSSVTGADVTAALATLLARTTPAFGCMFEDTVGAPTSIVCTLEDTYYPWLTAGAGLYDAGPLISFTSDAGGDYLEVAAGGAGKYLAEFNVSFGGTGSTNFIVALFVDAVESVVRCERKLGTGGDIGAIAAQGILDLAVGEKVRLKVQSTDGAGDTFAIDICRVVIARLEPA